MDEDINYRQDAEMFLDSILPSNFKEQIANYIEHRQYNHNEAMLFGYLLRDIVECHCSKAMIDTFLE